MTKLLSSISRALTSTPRADERVHFHGGPHGAYVCENAHCVSPGLDVADR